MSLDQFLDCLDFAPDVIKDMIKDFSVKLPLNDMEKRKAIQEKLGFDVTKAIEVENTVFDSEGNRAEEKSITAKRRTVPINTEVAAPTGRRYKPEPKNE